MALISGTYKLGGTFDIASNAPIDSRLRVEYESDLTSSMTWTNDTPIYTGLITYVMETGDIWKCIDAENYTSISNGWKIVGSSQITITGDDVEI